MVGYGKVAMELWLDFAKSTHHWSQDYPNTTSKTGGVFMTREWGLLNQNDKKHESLSIQPRQYI